MIWLLYGMFTMVNILSIYLVFLFFGYFLSFCTVKNSSRKFFRGAAFAPICRASFVKESRRKVKSLVTPAWGYRKKWRTVGRHSCQAPRWNFHDAIKFCKKLWKKHCYFIFLFFPSFYSVFFYFWVYHN